MFFFSWIWPSIFKIFCFSLDCECALSLCLKIFQPSPFILRISNMLCFYRTFLPGNRECFIYITTFILEISLTTPIAQLNYALVESSIRIFSSSFLDCLLYKLCKSHFPNPASVQNKHNSITQRLLFLLLFLEFTIFISEFYHNLPGQP